MLGVLTHSTEPGARRASDASPVELVSDDPQGYFNLAEFHYDNGNLDDAESCCRKAIQLDRQFAFAHLTLGNICLDKELPQEAVQCFQAFLKHGTSPASEDIRKEVAALIEGLRDES